MFCTECGVKLKEMAKYCHSCGYTSVTVEEMPESKSQFIEEQKNILKRQTKVIQASKLGRIKYNKNISDSSKETPNKTARCKCNKCAQHIEFEKSMTGTAIKCPSCGTVTELIQELETGNQAGGESEKIDENLQTTENDSTALTENQLKIANAYGAIESEVRKGIIEAKEKFICAKTKLKKKEKSKIIFASGISLVILFFLFGLITGESEVEKRKKFGGHVILCYAMLVMVEENSFKRIRHILDNWSIIGAEGIEKVARENPPQKIEPVNQVLEKLRSRKDVDIEMYDSIVELHDICLKIWELSKSPSGESLRNYSTKAVKLKQKFEPIKLKFERLYNLKSFAPNKSSL